MTTSRPVALVMGASSGIESRDGVTFVDLDVTSDESVAQVQRLFETNVFGVVRMTKAVLPHMRGQRTAFDDNTAPPDTPLPVYAKLHYAASPRARQFSALRRITPARTFDKQLRKFNKLAG